MKIFLNLKLFMADGWDYNFAIQVFILDHTDKHRISFTINSVASQ